MARIIIHKENGKVTAWEVRRLRLPDGTTRRYFKKGARALTDIINQWVQDCKDMDAGWSVRTGLTRRCP